MRVFTGADTTACFVLLTGTGITSVAESPNVSSRDKSGNASSSLVTNCEAVRVSCLSVLLELSDDLDEAVWADAVLRLVSVDVFDECRERKDDSMLIFQPWASSLWALLGMPSHFELTLGTSAGSFC